jgi:6-phosphogluconolactonase
MAGTGHQLMQMEICSTATAAGIRAAELIAERLRAAVAERGHGTVALSGGSTPRYLQSELALAALPWPQIDIFQVDERIVSADDNRSNMRAIRHAFDKSGIPLDQLHQMPVAGISPDEGAAQYAIDLCTIAGSPPRLDVVHLGLGDDGHTASLVMGDPASRATGEVAVTGLYAGVQRMTLTFRVLNLARFRVWLVCGQSKRRVVKRLLAGDTTMIAGRILRPDSILVVDEAAAG